ncbi:cytochrome P460, partial [Burkholderia contaminans]
MHRVGCGRAAAAVAPPCRRPPSRHCMPSRSAAVWHFPHAIPSAPGPWAVVARGLIMRPCVPGAAV